MTVLNGFLLLTRGNRSAFVIMPTSLSFSKTGSIVGPGSPTFFRTDLTSVSGDTVSKSFSVTDDACSLDAETSLFLLDPNLNAIILSVVIPISLPIRLLP